MGTVGEAMACRGWLGRLGRGERGWTVVDFVIASSIMVLIGGVAAFMYASGQKTMSETLRFLNVADQVSESTRGLEKWLAVAGMGAPTVYPSAIPLPSGVDATILLATSTAVTFLSEVDKEATFLVADVPVPAAPNTLPITSVSGFKDGDSVLIFDRFVTAEHTISGAPSGNTIGLSASVTLFLKERSQVSRPRRVTLSVVDDTWNTGQKMMLREVRNLQGTSVLESDAFGHGIASATFKYFDKAGVEITANLAQAAVRATIKEIMVEIVWPPGVQMPDRFKQGGQYKVQTRVRPWNLKVDRAN